MEGDEEVMVRWISFSLLVLLLTACAGNEEAENTSSPLEIPSIHQDEQTANPNPPDEEKDTVVGDISSNEEKDAVTEEERQRYYDAMYEDDIRPEPKERVGKLEIDSIVTAEDIQPEQKETVMKYLTAIRDEDVDGIEELIHPESESRDFVYTLYRNNQFIQSVKELTIDHHRSTLLEEERGEGMATAVVMHLENTNGSMGTAQVVLFKQGEKWLIYRVD